MDKRYDEIYTSAIGIAVWFNLWIRIHNVWYTPEGFGVRNHGHAFTGEFKRLIHILNPVEELGRGRWKIIQMVRDKRDPELIVSSIIKMAQFEEKIRHYKYAPSGWTLEVHDLPAVLDQYYNSPEPDLITMNDFKTFTEAVRLAK